MASLEESTQLVHRSTPGDKVLSQEANRAWARRIYAKLLAVVPELWRVESTVNVVTDEEVVLDLRILASSEGYRHIVLTQYSVAEPRCLTPDLLMEVGVYQDWEMAEALRYQEGEACETVYSGPEGTADRRYYLHGNALLEKWLEALNPFDCKDQVYTL